MDLETENRIAAILLKEAAELRRQSEREGALAYLRQPKARFRPNSRFLTATVLGAQQANRAVEVNEMWRVRQKEQELDERLKRSSGRSHRDSRIATNSTSRMNCDSCSSSKRLMERPYSTEDGGLRDNEVVEFLNSRVKCGRGACRVKDGRNRSFYLPPGQESTEWLSSSHDRIGHRVVIGLEKPSSLKSSSEGERRATPESTRTKVKKSLWIRKRGDLKITSEVN